LNGTEGYAVFFFPQALEVLGGAIKPYLVEAPDPYVLCKEIDTAGALVEMTLEGKTAEGREVTIELMVPGSMVRMIVSARSDGAFGFGVRPPASAAVSTTPAATTAPSAPDSPTASTAPTAPAAPTAPTAPKPASG